MKPTIRRSAWVLGLATVAATGMLAAQSSGSISIHAYGGGVHNLSQMTPNETYDTKFGTGFGGGIGYQVSDVFGIRADGFFTKSTLTYYGDEVADKMDRIYATFIVQFQLPEGRIRPYFLTGVGGTFINQHTPVEPKPSAPHWLGGAGVEIPFGSAGLAFRAETRVHVYSGRSLIGNATDAGRVMSDAAITGGLSYRLR